MKSLFFIFLTWFISAAAFATPTITGPSTVCAGSSISLTGPIGGGTWSSSNTSVATISSSSGDVTGLAVGTTVISYIAGAVVATATITVTPEPVPITGARTACIGTAIALSDGTPGGTWSSGNIAIATITSTGLVEGLASGTATITYTSPAGCFVTTTVTVGLSPVVGPTVICVGSSAALSGSGGATWSSSNTVVATVGASSGVVSGLTPGTSTITYSGSTPGCYATVVVTVVATATPIGGSPHICLGSTSLLTDAVSGGTWSSSNTIVAPVGSSSGVVTGLTPGTATITYSAGSGCTASIVVTVSGTSAPIMGSTSLCPGGATTLTDAATGGTWSSTSTAVATISGTGIVTGVSDGTATITYSLAGGCTATVIVTVAGPAISGSASVCVGSATVLSGSVGGGTWSSGSTAVATVGMASGVVTGVSAGTAVITYSTASGCTAHVVVTVSALPVFTVIGGPAYCGTGAFISLSGSTVGVTYQLYLDGAPVGSPLAGTGAALSFGYFTTPGVYTVVATMSSSGCTATMSGSVVIGTGAPPVSGTLAICVGMTTMLADSAGAGTWSSSSTAVATVGLTSGIVYGVSAGTSIITYSLGSGCTATAIVTVSPVPYGIGGADNLCAGMSVILGDLTTGGTWSSSLTSVATVSAYPLTVGSGLLTGVSAGTAIITYATGPGCFNTITVTVNPGAPITGPHSVCIGSAITLTDSVLGTWSSSPSSVATVSATGVVTGVSSGTATISWTGPGGCISTFVVTVGLSAITGDPLVCVGGTTTLSDAVTGGTWSSSNTGVAIIGSSSGVITGLSFGTSTITYSLGSGCASTIVVTVSPGPAPVSGAASLCAGASVTLTDSPPGGSWSSSNTAIATVGSSTGVVRGVAPGTTTITYSLGSGCTATVIVTVTPGPAPAPITGPTDLCSGLSIALTEASAGGTWSSGTTSVATITGAGIVTGISSGTTVITYTGPSGCIATEVITVNPVPGITGPHNVCTGATIALSDSTAGGTWSSSSSFIASIGITSGIVTGMSSGTATITYTLPSGCSATYTVTVGSPSITGTPFVCVGGTIVLSGSGTGTWSSSSTGIATVGSATGVVTGVASGGAMITFTTAAGCIATVTVTVGLTAITGSPFLCIGGTTTLFEPGVGMWSSGSTTVATVDLLSGIVTGVSSGTSMITFSSSTGCIAILTVTVSSGAPAITGSLNVCERGTTTLADAASGGTWSSSNTAVATVGYSSGTVTGLAPGTAAITYALSSGCTATAIVTVSPGPGPILGITSVCAGSTTLLSDTAGGGAWSSSNTGVALTGPGAVVVIGLSPGTSVVAYSIDSGCVVSVIVTVNPLPLAIAASSAPPCFTSGDTLRLSVLPAVAGETFTWSGPGGFSSTLEFPVRTPFSVADTGVYYLTVTSSFGCSATSATDVGLELLSPPVITGPAIYCQGTPFVPFVVTDSTGAILVSDLLWYTTSAGGAGSTTPSTINTSIPGVYTVWVSRSIAGCESGRASLAVTVRTTPPAPFVTGLSQYCQFVGLYVPLVVHSASGAIVSWYTSALGGVSTSTEPVPDINVVPPGGSYMYWVGQSDSGCQSPLMPVAITIHPKPNSPAAAPRPWCQFQSAAPVAATASTPGDVLLWYGPGLTIGTSTPPPPPTLTAPDTIDYYVSETSIFGCVSDSAIDTEIIIKQPPAPLTKNAIYCQHAQNLAPLNAEVDSAAHSYLNWYFDGELLPSAPIPSADSPTVVTWYVTQTVNTCESLRASVTVTVLYMPLFGIALSHPTVCQFDTISLMYNGSALEAPGYTWTLPEGASFVDGTHAWDDSVAVVFDSSARYNLVTLTVSEDSGKCSLDTSVSVNIVSHPASQAFTTPDVCIGDTVSLALNKITLDAKSFLWYIDTSALIKSPAVVIVSASSNSGGPFLFSWVAGGLHIIEVQSINEDGCKSQPSYDTVDVHLPPDADFKITSYNQTGCVTDTIQFSADSVNYNFAYQWAPAHSFESINTPVVTGMMYELNETVTLTVTDPFGCVATQNMEVDQKPCCEVNFPNAFTPNGDGKDDFFQPLFIGGFHRFHTFIITNRWGQVVFNSENSGMKWDGNFNGVPQDMGAYYYYIKYDCGTNTLEQKGDVTLIR